MGKGDVKDDLIVGTMFFCKIIGKTRQWVAELTKEGVLQQCGRGKYKLDENIQRYIEHLLGGKEDDKRPKLRDERAELVAIQKETARIKLQRMKGELHEAAEVEKIMNEMILTAKAKLLTIPSRLGLQLENEPSHVIEAAIGKEINAALASLADYNPEMFTDRAGETLADG